MEDGGDPAAALDVARPDAGSLGETKASTGAAGAETFALHPLRLRPKFIFLMGLEAKETSKGSVHSQWLRPISE
jgi:hypothetical protein